MKQSFVLGIALLALVGSGCATRGYARRQAATVNDRASQVQAQLTAQSAKHETDVARVNDRITATDNKLQEANTSAELANANAARADASAAQANATAARAESTVAQAAASAARAEIAQAQADANAARAEAARAQADATTARAEAAAAQERALIAQNTPPRAPARRERRLPATGSPLPLIGLSGLLSLVAAFTIRGFAKRLR